MPNGFSCSCYHNSVSLVVEFVDKFFCTVNARKLQCHLITINFIPIHCLFFSPVKLALCKACVLVCFLIWNFVFDKKLLNIFFAVSVAKRISEYPEVESVALMSGAYDLSVIVKGKTFQEIAMFVAKELAVIDSVTSTATNFIMKQYKEFSVELCSEDDDWRDKISL